MTKELHLRLSGGYDPQSEYSYWQSENAKGTPIRFGVEVVGQVIRSHIDGGDLVLTLRLDDDE